jgi:hypothetical protein
MATIRLLRTSWWYLKATIAVLAVLAAGVPTMSIAAPAPAQQARLAKDAEVAVAPQPAATDGLPVPALLGGLVLAFAVGLSAGHVARRRRVARRVGGADERPVRATTATVPSRPARPPEPVLPDPRPVEATTPAPPPPVRSHGPRILRSRAAPAPPPEPEVRESTDHDVTEDAIPDAVAEAPANDVTEERHEVAAEEPANDVIEEAPDEVVAEEPDDDDIEEAPDGLVAEEPVADGVVADEPAPDEIFVQEPAAEAVAHEPADEAVPREPAGELAAEASPDEIVWEPPAGVVADEPVSPAGPLGDAPEVPQADAAPSPPAARSAPPAKAPEALGRRAPPPAPDVHARRFAHAGPWPRDAATLWTCEIAWKAGYVKSTFRAMAGPPGGARRKPIAESPPLRWTLMTDPEPPTPEMIASVKVLVSALVAAGWERTGPGPAWYAQRFVWRRSGEPGPVVVPDEAGSA